MSKSFVRIMLKNGKTIVKKVRHYSFNAVLIAKSNFANINEGY